MIDQTRYLEELGRATSAPPVDPARAEMLAILQERASAGETIFYGDLVRLIKTVSLRANDPRLFALLDEISETEYRQGRGMLSVIVINRKDEKPGWGFFLLARKLGRDVGRPHDWWKEELALVHSYHAGLAAAPDRNDTPW